MNDMKMKDNNMIKDEKMNESTMIENIINDMNKTIQSLLPSVKSKIPSLMSFVIVPAGELASMPNIAPELRDELDISSFYMTLKFTPDGNRELAKQAFEEVMINKLGAPSTSDIDDEVLPKKDYTPDEEDNFVDIDDNGNVKNSIGQAYGSSVAKGKPKYYAVEFKIMAPKGRLGSEMGHKQLHSWKPSGGIGFNKGKMLGMY